MRANLFLLVLLSTFAPRAVRAADAFPKDWDVNGDGVLSLKEAKLAGMTRTQFKSTDTSKDGRVDLREFHAFIVSSIPDAQKSPYGPKESIYPGHYQSEYFGRLKSGETFILHRVIRDCETDKAMPEKMDGRRELVWKIGVKIGYVNAVCQSRKEEQCVLDGTKDQYYDERCETLDLQPVRVR